MKPMIRGSISSKGQQASEVAQEDAEAQESPRTALSIQTVTPEGTDIAWSLFEIIPTMAAKTMHNGRGQCGVLLLMNGMRKWTKKESVMSTCLAIGRIYM